ncbi:MAG: type II toxin-antitoxin system VapC family toxin [Anaerolineales bacterium]|nr:type II toxin-antitoxin system VapC family toxin [Anaerolineales bacterium]
MTTSKACCPDASVLVRFLISGEPGSAIATLWEGWLEAGYSLIAPTLIFYEVNNVLHQYVRHGQLTSHEAEAAFQLSFNLNIVTMMDVNLHQRALQMAQMLQLPATYDAHYLALAERMGAEFWTLDGKLVNKVNSQLSWVNLWQG